MNSDNYEARFSEFIDGKNYDAAQGAIFELVRAAFAAGWKAAKESDGEVCQPAEEK